MTQSRNAILDRLRKAQPPTAQRADQGCPTVSKAELSADTRLALWIHHLESAHAQVVLANTACWPEHLLATLPQPAPAHWLLSPEHPYASRWADALHGMNPLPEIRYYDQSINALKSSIFNSVDASLTSARFGIAETGTLVLEPTAQEPRLMSLVPPLHVAIVKASSVLSTFQDYLQLNAWAASTIPTNIVLISGPSKTADIQQTLAYGAHGPKALIVVVLTDA